MSKDFKSLKNQVQDIINHIGKNEKQEAAVKLAQVYEVVNELTDTVKEDAKLIELSYYQVLLKQLQTKISN